MIAAKIAGPATNDTDTPVCIGRWEKAIWYLGSLQTQFPTGGYAIKEI